MNRMTLAILAIAAAATPAMAQGRGRGNGGVPPGQRPPAGMCRIWIDGVPPGQQPAPTDCATAAAQRPANARIIYGDRTNANRGIFNDNGRIVTIDGRRCVQRTDRDGRIRTYCDDDRDDRYDSRIYRDNGDVRLDREKHEKHEKHKNKGKGHGDHDGDR